MEIPEASNADIKIAAFLSAISEVFASLAGDVQILRELLERKGALDRREFDGLKLEFAQKQWPAYVCEIDAKIRQLAERKLQNMTRGTVH